MELVGTSAVVTGAAQGIGFGGRQRLARHGPGGRSSAPTGGGAGRAGWLLRGSWTVRLASPDGIGHDAAARGAVSQFAEVAAAELAPVGIRVNAVAPGLTRTRMSEAEFLSGRMLEEFLAHTPLG